MVTMGVFPFQRKTHMVEPGIEPGISWLVVRSSDHQATRLVTITICILTGFYSSFPTSVLIDPKIILNNFTSSIDVITLTRDTSFLNNTKKTHTVKLHLLNCSLYLVITYSLTPWSRVLVEKLTGSQIVKKFPEFYGTRRYITAFTTARHLSLSSASSIQSRPPPPTS